jgi:hypothetical protein
MVFLWGTVRMAGTVLAVLAGASGWPIWVIPAAIAIHAVGGFFVSKALYAEVQEGLRIDNADPVARERHAIFYRPLLFREFALAFVKCGIAYFVGFWLMQFGAGSDAPMPEGRIPTLNPN